MRPSVDKVDDYFRKEQGKKSAIRIVVSSYTYKCYFSNMCDG